MTTPDERKRVLLDMIPPDHVFLHTYDGDSLWRAASSGYVNERDPLRAGLYEPGDHYAPWAPPSRIECPECGGVGERDGDYENESPPCGTCEGMCYVANPEGRKNDHSFTLDAAELLGKYASNVQDGTVLALLLDEVLRLRKQASAAQICSGAAESAAERRVIFVAGPCGDL